MSEAQLQKLQLERDTLHAELQLLQSSIPVPRASQLVMQQLNGKVDPFQHAGVGGGGGGGGGPQEQNEWVTESSGGGGCCTVQ